KACMYQRTGASRGQPRIGAYRINKSGPLLLARTRLQLELRAAECTSAPCHDRGIGRNGSKKSPACAIIPLGLLPYHQPDHAAVAESGRDSTDDLAPSRTTLTTTFPFFRKDST